MGFLSYLNSSEKCSLWWIFHCSKRNFSLRKPNLHCSFITWKCSELCFLLSVLFLNTKRKWKQRIKINFEDRSLPEQLSVPFFTPLVPPFVPMPEPCGIVLKNDILDKREEKFAVKTWYWEKHAFWLCNYLVGFFWSNQTRYSGCGFTSSSICAVCW